MKSTVEVVRETENKELIQNYIREAMNVAYVVLVERYALTRTEPPISEDEAREFIINECWEVPMPVGPKGIKGHFPFITESGSQVE